MMHLPCLIGEGTTPRWGGTFMSGMLYRACIGGLPLPRPSPGDVREGAGTNLGSRG
jgi:hypothetical protein